MAVWRQIPGFFSITECSRRLQFGHILLVTILQCTTEPFLAICSPFFRGGTIMFENLPVFHQNLPFFNFCTSKWHFKCKNLKKGLCSALLHTLEYALKKKKYLNHSPFSQETLGFTCTRNPRWLPIIMQMRWPLTLTLSFFE